MSVRSFHSVFMATAVAGAALGCYLVSLRVASERAALEQVERQIVSTQRDIRLIQTEIGTRARLAQLERWNVRVLALSAPTADQILGDRFQLASLVEPERKPALEAPVILAAAPARIAEQPLAQQAARPANQLLHEAGLELPSARQAEPKAAVADPAAAKPARTPGPSDTAGKIAGTPAKSAENAEKKVKSPSAAVKPPVRTAKVDPLAPLPTGSSAAKGSRTQR